MSLEQIAEATAPQSALRFDTSLHIHLTDADGKLVISTTTGKPITIAQDLTSGAWYAKAADSFPFHSKMLGKAAREAALAELVDAGGVHVAHDDERFRGVWVPMAWVTEVQGTPADPASND
jgi:hypothetical protein